MFHVPAHKQVDPAKLPGQVKPLSKFEKAQADAVAKAAGKALEKVFPLGLGLSFDNVPPWMLK